MLDNKNPIGLFDSGVGGTSIWREVHLLLPHENTIYLADSKNAPYGIKSPEEITRLSVKNSQLLLDMGCKLIIVACNTATTNAINFLRTNFNVPFIGIEPAIKPAANYSVNHCIGVLATKGTLTSHLFSQAVQLFSGTNIIEQIGYGLVELIEAGQADSQQMIDLLKTYLQPMIDANIDFLVLGCSHYPYIIPQIKQILPPHIQIIDSGEAVARQTQKMLQTVGSNYDGPGNASFISNGNTAVLQKLLGKKYKVTYQDF